MRSVISIKSNPDTNKKNKIYLHCPVRKLCILGTSCYRNEAGESTLPCRVEQYHRGDLIWCNSIEDSYAYTIRSGVVSIEKCNHEGGEVILGILFNGQAFGLAGLYNHRPRSYYVHVIKETELCRFPLIILEHLIKSDPFVAERVVQSLAETVDMMIHQVEILCHPHAVERIRCLLERLGRRFTKMNGGARDGGARDGGVRKGGAKNGGNGGGEDNWIRLPLTHQDLAYLAGINRVTVTRSLHQLEKEGLVRLGNRNILVCPCIPVITS